MDRADFVKLLGTASMALLAPSLPGCAARGDGGNALAPSSSAGSADDGASANAGQAAQTPSADGKVLVTYFSWSGNTKILAEHIQAKTGADLVRIEPVTPYSDDYNTVLDAAQDEKNNDVRPELATSVDGWDEYGTVFLGYPIWWYDAPQIIKSFLDAYDCSGKLLVAFCTSGGSQLSTSLDSITAGAGDATIADGITLSGSSVSSHLDEADAWLAGLGF